MKSATRQALVALGATLLLAVSCTSGSTADDDNQSPDPTTLEDSATQALPASAVNELNPGRTEHRSATLREATFGAAQPACEAISDGTLRLGSLLPQTGKLDYLEPVQQAATQLAIDDIFGAGGITGLEFTYSPGDSGDSETTLVTTRRHLEQGADIILGPPSSVLSKQVTAEITGNCRIQISAGNTAAGFESVEQNGMYFRTAPSDQLQGQALADLVSQSGAAVVSIIAEGGDYGAPLAGFTTAAFERLGIESQQTLYNPELVDFNAAADQATDNDPDAIVLIGFEESGQILAELLRRGVRTQQIYLSDGNAGDALGEQFDSQPNQLNGIRGIQPGADIPSTFRQRLTREDSRITDFSFGPETYDAVIISALAAEVAQTDNPAEVARQINDVTRDGTRCTSFAQCKRIIAGGERNIDYDGISGPLAFGANGEPTTATFAVVEFG